MDEPPFDAGDTHPQAPQPAWTAWDMVTCTVIVLVSLFVITTIIVGPFMAQYGRGAPETLIASGAANLVWNAAMILAVVFFVRRRGGVLRDLGFRAPIGYEHPWIRGATVAAGFAVLAYLTLTILVIGYGVIVQQLGLEFLEPDQQIPDDFYDSDTALAVLGVAVVLGAPITEEIFFRGFLFGGAKRYLGLIGAALVTGFLFSLAHYNPGLIIPFTAVGFVLALSYYRTGSLYVPIGAHLIFNLVSFSVLVFVPEARP